MRTLLYGSDRPREPAAINAANEDASIGDKPTVPAAAPPEAPPSASATVSRPSDRPSPPMQWYALHASRRSGTLPAMTRGLIAVAVIWAGMAIFLAAFVYPMGIAARVLLAILGAWLAATGAAYVIAEAPAGPTTGLPRAT
jgi:hypothetical protein